MGFAPCQVEDMSLWAFNVAFDGWCRAQGVGEKDSMLTDEMMSMFDEIVGSA